jgi:hypothetical protein
MWIDAVRPGFPSPLQALSFAAANGPELGCEAKALFMGTVGGDVSLVARAGQLMPERVAESCNVAMGGVTVSAGRDAKL